MRKRATLLSRRTNLKWNKTTKQFNLFEAYSLFRYHVIDSVHNISTPVQLRSHSICSLLASVRLPCLFWLGGQTIKSQFSRNFTVVDIYAIVKHFQFTPIRSTINSSFLQDLELTSHRKLSNHDDATSFFSTSVNSDARDCSAFPAGDSGHVWKMSDPCSQQTQRLYVMREGEIVSKHREILLLAMGFKRYIVTMGVSLALFPSSGHGFAWRTPRLQLF